MLVAMLILAASLSFVYGVDMKDAYDHAQAGAGGAHPSGSASGCKAG